MSEQLSLDGTVEVAGPRLTERQHFALRELARFREGLTQDELGALLHERRGTHPDWQRCQWCSSDGLGVLKALRKKGLVVRRRPGQWQMTTVGRGVVYPDETGSGENQLSAEGHIASTRAPAGNGDSGDQRLPGHPANTPSGEVPVRPSPRPAEPYDPSTAEIPF